MSGTAKSARGSAVDAARTDGSASERPYEEIGKALAQARERRQLSLAEIACRTKISIATLRAIERDDLKALPRGIYRRGFLRAYAAEVGCDPEEIVRRYRARFADEGPDVELFAADGRREKREVPRVRSADIDAMDRRSARAHMIAGAAAVLVSTGMYWWFGHEVRTALPRSEATVVDTSAQPPAPPPPPLVQETIVRETGTSGSGEAPAPAAPPSQSLQVDIQPRGECWVSGTADGERVIYRLLNDGEHVRLEAHEAIVLRVGDPARLEVTINGAAARSLGPAGEAVTLRLTPQNFRKFLHE